MHRHAVPLCDSEQKKKWQEFGLKRYEVTHSFVCARTHVDTNA